MAGTPAFLGVVGGVTTFLGSRFQYWAPFQASRRRISARRTQGSGYPVTPLLETLVGDQAPSRSSQGLRTHLLNVPEIWVPGLSSRGPESRFYAPYSPPPKPMSDERGGSSRRPAPGGGPSAPSLSPATFLMAGLT